MKRIFAEIEDRDGNIWGCDCPNCRGYIDFENPNTRAQEISCEDCNQAFLVSFV